MRADILVLGVQPALARPSAADRKARDSNDKPRSSSRASSNGWSCARAVSASPASSGIRDGRSPRASRRHRPGRPPAPARKARVAAPERPHAELLDQQQRSRPGRRAAPAPHPWPRRPRAAPPRSCRRRNRVAQFIGPGQEKARMRRRTATSRPRRPAWRCAAWPAPGGCGPPAGWPRGPGSSASARQRLGASVPMIAHDLLGRVERDARPSVGPASRRSHRRARPPRCRGMSGRPIGRLPHMPGHRRRADPRPPRSRRAGRKPGRAGSTSSPAPHARGRHGHGESTHRPPRPVIPISAG